MSALVVDVSAARRGLGQRRMRPGRQRSSVWPMAPSPSRPPLSGTPSHSPGSASGTPSALGSFAARGRIPQCPRGSFTGFRHISVAGAIPSGIIQPTAAPAHAFATGPSSLARRPRSLWGRVALAKVRPIRTAMQAHLADGSSSESAILWRPRRSPTPSPPATPPSASQLTETPWVGEIC